MEEYLGVIVEPWDIENNTRHNKIYDALYGFEEKCVVSDDIEKYGGGDFDIVGYSEFSSYWENSSAEQILMAGDLQSTVDLVSDLDISPDDLNFENYTVKGLVERPQTGEVLIDELKSMLPLQERRQLVKENTAFERLEEMEVPQADTIHLQEVAKPPERTIYFRD